MGLTKQQREARSAAAALLGALGAAKGGRARARKLDPARRKAIAGAGGRAYAKLSKRKRTQASRRGWATRRAKALEVQGGAVTQASPNAQE